MQVTSISVQNASNSVLFSRIIFDSNEKPDWIPLRFRVYHPLFPIIHQQDKYINRIDTSYWRENSFGPFCQGYISLRIGFPILGFRLGRVHSGGGNKSSGTFYHLLGDVGDPDQAQVFAEPAIFAAQALDAATDNDSTRLDIIIFMRERKIISVSTMLVAIIKWCWWW